MARIGVRLSVRTLVDLVALAAVGLGAWKLSREARPPGPAVRALKAGEEADRVAALRALSLTGAEGVPAIPALIATARDDPSPAVRRGAVHALTRIAADEDRLEFPIDAALAGPSTAGNRVPPGPRPGPGLPLLRPRSDESALVIAEVMRLDPEPTVRAYALRALRKILDAADRERALARAPRSRKPGEPVPRHLASGRWVEAVARSIAGRTVDPDPEVAGHAIGFLGASRGKEVLPVDERIAALLAAVEARGAPLPLDIDVMTLSLAASLMEPGHPDVPRLIDLAIGRLDDPPATGSGLGGPEVAEISRESARSAYARILWRYVGSADDLRDRPELRESLIPMLSLSWWRERRMERIWSTGRWDIHHMNARLTADQHQDLVGTGSASYHGGAPELPSLHAAVLGAIVRDPRLLELIWPRIDRPGRHHWLSSDQEAFAFGGVGGWERLMALLSSPAIRPELPGDRCEAILDGLLDESDDPTLDAWDRFVLSTLQREVTRRRHGQNASPADRAPIEAAQELGTLRELAVLTYFARGVAPGAGGVERLVGRLRGLLGSEDAETRLRSARLLGSLGEAAGPAVSELDAIAGGDPDEATREAAGGALEAIRGNQPGQGESEP